MRVLLIAPPGAGKGTQGGLVDHVPDARRAIDLTGLGVVSVRDSRSHGQEEPP